MNPLKFMRLAIASALVMAMPLQAVGAAVRPSAAIPAAARTVGAQDEGSGGGGGIALPAIGVIIAAIVLALILERHNGRGRGTGFSR